MVVQDDPEDVEVHRTGDRHLDEMSLLSLDAALYAEFDDEPTHEKWRRGRTWR